MIKGMMEMIKNRCRVQFARMSLFHSLASYVRWVVNVHRCRLNYRRVVNRIREGASAKKIRILFLVHNPSKWKAQSLYEQLLKDGHYEPIMAIDFFTHELGKCGSAAEKMENDARFYRSLGNICVPAYDAERHSPIDLFGLRPDIVFYQEPWLIHPNHSLVQVSKFALCCYMPYSVEYVMNPNDGPGVADDIHFIRYFHQLMFINFTWSDCHAKYYLSKRHSWERAGTTLGLGHTILDQFKFLGDKIEDGYTIYAPHFSITHGDWSPKLKLATFKETGKVVLDYAKLHPELNWVFKPHPNMRHYFVETGYMTPDDVDAYFAEWGKIGKVCCDGDYPRLFNNSRALISDSCSFLLEYAVTGQPIVRPVPSDLNVFPCPAAAPVIHSLYETHGQKELMDTLKSILEENCDPKRQERVDAARRIGLVGTNAARNIVDHFNDILTL